MLKLASDLSEAPLDSLPLCQRPSSDPSRFQKPIVAEISRGDHRAPRSAPILRAVSAVCTPRKVARRTQGRPSTHQRSPASPPAHHRKCTPRRERRHPRWSGRWWQDGGRARAAPAGCDDKAYDPEPVRERPSNDGADHSPSPTGRKLILHGPVACSTSRPTVSRRSLRPVYGRPTVSTSCSTVRVSTPRPADASPWHRTTRRS